MAVMKYVMVTVQYKGAMIDVPVLFSARISHKDVARAAQFFFDSPPGGARVRGNAVESAGFVNVDVKGVFGNSESMSLEHRTTDIDVMKGCGQYDLFL